MDHDTSNPSSPELGLGDIQRRAFEQLEHVIRAVPREKLKRPNIRPYVAAQIVIGAAPRYLRLRARMATMGPELNLALIDGCAALAHAYCYASQKYVVYSKAQPLLELRKEAIALRDLLQRTLELLQDSDRVRVFQVSEPRKDTSYKSLSHDLTALVRFFDETWAELSGGGLITREQLARGGVLARQLLESDAVRDERAEALREYRLLAHQAFVAMCQAYDEVQRAVSFLRWQEGDAEEFAPSLHGPRKRSSRPASQEAVARAPAAEGSGDAVQGASAAPFHPDLRE